MTMFRVRIRICWIRMFLGILGSTSGSVRQRDGSETYYHEAKIVRKTMISTVL
jgi:hypothetical protein